MRFFLGLALPLLHVFATEDPCQKNEYYVCCQPQPQRQTDLTQFNCYDRTLFSLLVFHRGSALCNGVHSVIMALMTSRARGDYSLWQNLSPPE